MNQPMLLHIVERLEGFLGKLPERIQKPILTELTPLKELFLQQRTPRFVFAGSAKTPAQQILAAIFPASGEQANQALVEVYRWQEMNLVNVGMISLLDVRGSDATNGKQIEDQLSRDPADIIFFVDDGDTPRSPRKKDLDRLVELIQRDPAAGNAAKIIGLQLNISGRAPDAKSPERKTASPVERLRAALEGRPEIRARLLDVLQLQLPDRAGSIATTQSNQILSILARNVPNAARVEIVRMSGDREAQREIAQVLVKSTTAICTAIGTQPIPLADLPILTTLQLVMVSGIMYISGRERSLRAATEFMGALGANVGAGMILREGTRAILKFFPGWGNVVCGMVAGAGTYAMGRASTAFFLDGVTLKDARRTYLANRKRRALPALRAPEKSAKRNGSVAK